jgi:hypothetical protein
MIGDPAPVGQVFNLSGLEDGQVENLSYEEDGNFSAVATS